MTWLIFLINNSKTVVRPQQCSGYTNWLGRHLWSTPWRG